MTQKLTMHFDRKDLKLVAALSMLIAFGQSCAAPRQLCAAKMLSQTRALDAQIARSEATLARGYALHERSVPYAHVMPCYDETNRAEVCFDVRLDDRSYPVSVDMEAERARLRALKSSRNNALRRAKKGLEACQAHYLS